MTEERIPRDAALQLNVAAGSGVGGEGRPQSQRFASVEAARDATAVVAGAAARSAADAYVSAVRLQALAGEASHFCKLQFLVKSLDLPCEVSRSFPAVACACVLL